MTNIPMYLWNRMIRLNSLSINLNNSKIEMIIYHYTISLRWRHNECDSVSNHQPHDCLLNRLFKRRSKKTSKLRVTGLCAVNSSGTGEFPAQMASYAENVSIWWRHHVGWNVTGRSEIWWKLYIHHAMNSDLTGRNTACLYQEFNRIHIFS